MSDEIPLWKQKYPTANHAPRPGCKRCGGVGFYMRKAIVDGQVSIPPGETPCACIFISHNFVDEATKMLGDFARKELKKMRTKKK